MERMHFAVDRCVICGAIVEEGRWVCGCCEEQWATIKHISPETQQPVQEEKTRKKRWFSRKKIEK